MTTIEQNTATINALSAVADKLTEQDQRFATDLVKQWDRKQVLSPRQWAWVTRLTERANGKGPAKVDTPDTAQILAALNKAGKNEAYPSIEMPGTGGVTFRFALQGKRAKWPGSVQISMVPAGETDRVWLGRILPDGTWQFGRSYQGQNEEIAVVAAINAFYNKPVKRNAARKQRKAA